MNTQHLHEYLAALPRPTLEPGDHMERIEARILSHAAERKRPRGKRGWVRLALLGGIVFLTVGLGAGPWLSSITRAVGWSETKPQWLPLGQVPEAYRVELKRMWENGEGVLAETLNFGWYTDYRIRFTFKDGHSELVTAAAPPDPAQRAELRRLMDEGRGEVLAIDRDPQTGCVVYTNRYTLADGHTVTVGSSFPVMAKAQQEAAMKSVDSQHLAGTGVIVGRSDGMYVVEYKLPDGRPFTSMGQTPPAAWTPEREREILMMRRWGAGQLIEQAISADGWSYVIEYTLPDGSIFRVGSTRPPMSDEAWASATAEARDKVRRGEYEFGTVTGFDGKVVRVARLTLTSGQELVIPLSNPDYVEAVFGVRFE